ncbi:hypothetical protein Ddye_021425 [Dipteronia dyeriana]|uniref:Uncharacterized protein n=1 Tax=Dipteronia dyeriana TaxID=168575 RepID=A0AAD9WXZ2_9ROSI|nr:hypothetical protein Ddye_021425 [Dipteronia dyeriana]
MGLASDLLYYGSIGPDPRSKVDRLHETHPDAGRSSQTSVLVGVPSYSEPCLVITFPATSCSPSSKRSVEYGSVLEFCGIVILRGSNKSGRWFYGDFQIRRGDRQSKDEQRP